MDAELLGTEELNCDVVLINDEEPIVPLATLPPGGLTRIVRHGARSHCGTGHSFGSDYGVNVGAKYVG